MQCATSTCTLPHYTKQKKSALARARETSLDMRVKESIKQIVVGLAGRELVKSQTNHCHRNSTDQNTTTYGLQMKLARNVSEHDTSAVRRLNKTKTK